MERGDNNDLDQDLGLGAIEGRGVRVSRHCLGGEGSDSASEGRGK